MRRATYWLPVIAVFAGILQMPVASGAQGPSDNATPNGPRPVVRTATRTDISVPVRQMPELPPKPAVLGEIFERPIKRLPHREGSVAPPATTDPALQAPITEPGAPTAGPDFEGTGNVNGVLPPDTVGAIGPDYYIQMVNLSFAIYNRSGILQKGPVDINTMWAGFGGPCESTNDGDPVVLYDHLADRWLMSQLALPRFPRGPFYQCVAVSQTGNPLGSWYRYEFLISNSKLNDYPKLGVWPDGYYMSINQYQCKFIGCSWSGAGAIAFERDKMLLGQQAQMVYFDLYNTDANLGGMLPSDLDGPTPPAGAPNHFAQIDDNAWGYSPDQVQIWDFHVNWSNPGSSTFTKVSALQTASFDSNLCGYARNCIPQPGGTNVDALSDRLMYRLQYRNFGTHQTLMLNHTVDVNGADRAGIRWYELRNTSGAWSIFQQGTFSPDSNHRWMGSIAMNSMGDIGLGYSVSSTSVYPSIRATGRVVSGDPPPALGTMTQGETTIKTGSGYQTHSSGRWGDYSSMTVDPADDCTFWYTQEYYDAVSSASWKTFIGSFKFRNCASAGNPPTVTIVAPAAGTQVFGTVPIQISASDIEDTVGTLNVQWNIDGGGWTSTIYNSVTNYYEAFWDTKTASEGNHTLNAQATDSGGLTGNDSHGVVVNNVNDPPTASFTFSCNGLTCNFNGSGSSDPDGTISTYEWNFGDGSSGSGATPPSHTYAAAGTYTVTLTVTDDGGAQASQNQNVQVSSISLSASGYKVKGLQKADLSWFPSGGGTIDVYRDGGNITPNHTENDGFYTDNINQRGGGTYVYQVCVTGTATCSNQATVSF